MPTFRRRDPKTRPTKILSEEEAKKNLTKKLRKVLGRENLDAVHLDLIKILTTHCRDELLQYIAATSDLDAEIFNNYYMAKSASGAFLCEGRNPYEIVGLTDHLEGTQYFRFSKFIMSEKHWSKWKPGDDVLKDEETERYRQIAQESDE